MPLANEFQQKLQNQAQEMRAQTLPVRQGPKEHNEDSVLVRNILVGDNTEIQEAIPYATARNQPLDPRTPAQFNFDRLENNIYEHSWNTKDYFEVRWDGRPHRIKPGETRIFPRYLADHFAKNLIDFILTKREESEKLQGLVKNRSERAKLYKQIIVEVVNYYNGDGLENLRDGLRVEQQVEQLNAPNALNIGEVVNPALGYGTTDEAPTPIQPTGDVAEATAEDVTPTPAPTSTGPKTPQDIADSKTRKELIAEANQLGIKVTPNMDKVAIAAAILAF